MTAASVDDTRMIVTDAMIHKGLWFLFRTDLGGGPAGVLLSLGMTVAVATTPSWRKWGVRTPQS